MGVNLMFVKNFLLNNSVDDVLRNGRSCCFTKLT